MAGVSGPVFDVYFIRSHRSFCCGQTAMSVFVGRAWTTQVHLEPQGARSNGNRPSSGATVTPIGKLKPAA
jgi:hypothetical protein